MQAELRGENRGAGPAPQALRRAEDRLALAELREAVTALPAEQKAGLALVAIDGLSCKEAAAALDIPIGTVMSRLPRAREKLMHFAAEDAR